MRRRGFTFVELMIAMSISAVMMAAVGGMLMSVWLMAKESTDEVDCALHACALRQRLFHRLTDKDGVVLDVGGLSDATNILCCAEGAATSIVAAFPTGAPWTVDLAGDAAAVRYFGLDAAKRRAADYRQGAHAGDAAPPALQYVYIAIEGRGRAVYYDRMIVPIFGRTPDRQEFMEAIGGSRWVVN